MALSAYIFLDPKILTEDEILEIYKNAIDLYKSGITVMSWQGEGTQASNQFTAPIQDILREARMALKQGWPKKYGYFCNRAKVIVA